MTDYVLMLWGNCMDRDKIVGAVLLLAGLGGVCTYFWLVFFVAPLLVLQITAFGAVAVVLMMGVWIGYALAMTRQSKSVEEIERELEEELVQVEAEERT
ncbi:transcriptional regulator [Candidatus Bathyarchaeota archaeon]|nr:transcriptional regulator [Candidatus Bathyarchaeota archaeon]